MSGTIWSKFFWNDWESEEALRMCSLAAQGLWMRMLCLAAKAKPTGYVLLNGEMPTPSDLARLCGASEAEVSTLLAELDRWGVFSRDRQGRIYSRRMVREAKKLAIARQNGAKGGNPSLRKQTVIRSSDNPPVKLVDKPHKPEAISQEPIEEKTTLQCSPDTAAGAPIDHERLLDQLWRAAGPCLRQAAPGLQYLEWPTLWLREGFDLELDILPAIRDRAARLRRPQTIETWKFFDGAVRDWADSRRRQSSRNGAGRIINMDEINALITRDGTHG